MNNLKINPVGIDAEIQIIQTKLHDRLGYNLTDAYGRVYLIEKEGKKIATNFVKGNDYKEIIIKNQNAVFFFIENDTTKVEKSRTKTDIDIIFFLDLKKIKPNVLHRADAEVRVDILKVLKSIRMFNLFEITKGKDAISFDTNLIDMQPYHFLKFSGTLYYNINC